jgi:hypothetical protein
LHQMVLHVGHQFLLIGTRRLPFRGLFWHIEPLSRWKREY